MVWLTIFRTTETSTEMLATQVTNHSERIVIPATFWQNKNQENVVSNEFTTVNLLL